MTPLDIILNLLFGLGTGAIVSVLQDADRERLDRALAEQQKQRQSMESRRLLIDDVRRACVHFGQQLSQRTMSPVEKALVALLGDEMFQADLFQWLQIGVIEEGEAVKSKIVTALVNALQRAGASPQQVEFLQTGFFESFDHFAAKEPWLAHYRHQLSLGYLREQVDRLRQVAEEAAGRYAPERQSAALDQYCEKALKAWDIIDLTNLPAEDVQIGTQALLLRQLYMPLRLDFGTTAKEGGRSVGVEMIEADRDVSVEDIEAARDTRRLREAGRAVATTGQSASAAVSVGTALTQSPRLVALGDPGGGKTTLLRWLATAFLLHYRKDPAFDALPDVATLPPAGWIPVLIRCRDLGDADLCRGFRDFLAQHLQKSELLPEDAAVMCAVILDRIARGEALLLVDGLDEITNPSVRVQFCQELERTAARYPEARVVVTSRIVGYRDMPYRMGRAFAHGVVAELTDADKDGFANRWIAVTEPHVSVGERRKHAIELIEALHSSDRIARLTGNPMLLTTLALVKRKVGKLPSRRNKLYAEAVSVLLNWNPRHYKAIDDEEAIPQLEYLAWDMSRRGVQRLAEEEVLQLLERVRLDYPNLRSVKRQRPEDFLSALEARSSLLIKSGSDWLRGAGHEKPLWEFRHLTFQEYLAARAMLDGRYPGRDKTKTLAEQVAPLAGSVVEGRPGPRVSELEVVEGWQEALRLLLADCPYDYSDDVLNAVATPLPGEDEARTGRPRAVLAARCLADEPNVSEEAAEAVLRAFARRADQRDGRGRFKSALDDAAREVGRSHWAGLLRLCLIEEFQRRPDPLRREDVGSLWAMIEADGAEADTGGIEGHFQTLTKRISGSDIVDALAGALTVMQLAFMGRAVVTPGLTGALAGLLRQGGRAAHAASWAFRWLAGPSPFETSRPAAWTPSRDIVLEFIGALRNSPSEETVTRIWLIRLLGVAGDPDAIDALLEATGVGNTNMRREAVQALVEIGDERPIPRFGEMLDEGDLPDAMMGALASMKAPQAMDVLAARLDHPALGGKIASVLHSRGDSRGSAKFFALLQHLDGKVRQAAIGDWASVRDQNVRVALSRDADGARPWFDPRDVVTVLHVDAVAKRLEITTAETRTLFQSLAEELPLRLGWEATPVPPAKATP